MPLKIAKKCDLGARKRSRIERNPGAASGSASRHSVPSWPNATAGPTTAPLAFSSATFVAMIAWRRTAVAAWALLLLSVGCTPQGDPAIGPTGFADDFEREELGEVWHSTGGPYRIRDGQLSIRGAKNRPLWLRRTLPRDVRIEFDARSESPEGDIKVEVFGDGVSKAETESYTATSYVVLLGGWGNSTNAIARMDEHGSDRVMGPKRPIEPHRTYRIAIERRGQTFAVFVDGKKMMEMVDPEPLAGRGHDHFAFNNWQSDLVFDNLKITPL